VHDGAKQSAPAQTRDAQSIATRHPFAVEHFGQALPPQSTSVSVPFLTASVHSAVPQVWFGKHFHDMQSPGTLQTFPAAHGTHAPPQSTSVSVPFFTPSRHVGGAGGAASTGGGTGPASTIGTSHIHSMHRLLTQSAPLKQASPRAQGKQAGPPQSMSVSVPLRTPSVHVGGVGGGITPRGMHPLP
jgi:hypothetical protein